MIKNLCHKITLMSFYLPSEKKKINKKIKKIKNKKEVSKPKLGK